MTEDIKQNVIEEVNKECAKLTKAELFAKLVEARLLIKEQEHLAQAVNSKDGDLSKEKDKYNNLNDKNILLESEKLELKTENGQLKNRNIQLEDIQKNHDEDLKNSLFEINRLKQKFNSTFGIISNFISSLKSNIDNTILLIDEHNQLNLGENEKIMNYNEYILALEKVRKLNVSDK